MAYIVANLAKFLKNLLPSDHHVEVHWSGEGKSEGKRREKKREWKRSEGRDEKGKEEGKG